MSLHKETVALLREWIGLTTSKSIEQVADEMISKSLDAAIEASEKMEDQEYKRWKGLGDGEDELAIRKHAYMKSRRSIQALKEQSK